MFNNIYKWFRKLSERLRYVRVICGDWNSVCGVNWEKLHGNIGMFFDPPYGVKDRDSNLYHHDSLTIAKDVLTWCKEKGSIDKYRIVIAGYDEYIELLDNDWTKIHWETQGGFSCISGKANSNSKREVLYLSPHCRKKSKGLFFVQ